MSRASKENWSLWWLARNRPYPMIILSGIFLAAAFPPSPLAFLAFFGFVPLLMVIEQTPDRVFEDRFWGFFKGVLVNIWRIVTLQIWWRYRGKNWRYQRKIISHYAQVFRYAYIAFAIWNFGCCYWLMMTAFGASSFAEVLTFISAGLVANVLNPFLMTIPVYLYAKARRNGLKEWAPFAFAIFWITFEWLHFHWDLSWSWLTLGHAFTMYPLAWQYLEFTGVLGLSLQALVINALLFMTLRAWRGNSLKMRPYGWAAVVAIALPFVLNLWILQPNRDVFQPSGEIAVRVIQPNIDPYEKFQQGTRQAQINNFVELITRPGLDTIDLVILPETALPDAFFVEDLPGKPLLQPLWSIIDSTRVSMIAGFNEFRYFDPRFDKVPPSVLGPYREGFYDVCNSAAMMRPGPEAESFQKAKLVPLVEGMPFQEHLGFLEDINISLAGAASGLGKPDSVRTLQTSNGVGIASLICYESEYGDYVREFIQKGATIITIITNDGWWRESSGHIQHAHLASLRAVETRRAIARSANTGISLFTDNRGNFQQPTEYGVPAVIDARLPLYDSQTFYVRHGDYLGRISGYLTVFVLVYLLVFGLLLRLRHD